MIVGIATIISDTVIVGLGVIKKKGFIIVRNTLSRTITTTTNSTNTVLLVLLLLQHHDSPSLCLIASVAHTIMSGVWLHEHIHKSLTFTPYECAWIPLSASFVVVGQVFIIIMKIIITIIKDSDTDYESLFCYCYYHYRYYCSAAESDWYYPCIRYE